MEGFLKLFIDDLESKVGSLYYDEDFDISDDGIRLELEEYPGIVVEVDILLDHMDIYQVFSYYDYKKSEREAVDKEEIEQEISRYYEQKDFEKAVSMKYKVEVWEDDCWGCPCLDILVGLRNVKCDIGIVEDFIKIYSTVNSSIMVNDFSEIKKQRLERLLESFLQKANFKICERKDISYIPIEENCVVSYIGKEYVLLKNNLETAAIKKSYYDLFFKILEEVEYFSDYRVEIYPKYIKYITCSYEISISRIDEDEALNIETLYFNINLQDFILFADGENLSRIEKTFNENNVYVKDVKMMFVPHIYTEGQTDCLHIKSALQSSLLYNGREWVFDEGITNKGDRELLKTCEVFGNRSSEATCARIAIFDRDGSISLKEIEDDKKGFKDWGNRMYSFALPVPKHREKTPNISIEHYYSDEELFREYNINGINRRLYMGWEFDNIGRAVSLRKVRRSSNKCGPKSIAILDSEVYDMDTDTNIDYALSKSKFAEQMSSSKLSKEAVMAFDGLFAKIMEVLRYDEENYGKLANNRVLTKL